jgi:hypothetical protein
VSGAGGPEEPPDLSSLGLNWSPILILEWIDRQERQVTAAWDQGFKFLPYLLMYGNFSHTMIDQVSICRNDHKRTWLLVCLFTLRLELASLVGTEDVLLAGP